MKGKFIVYLRPTILEDVTAKSGAGEANLQSVIGHLIRCRQLIMAHDNGTQWALAGQPLVQRAPVPTRHDLI